MLYAGGDPGVLFESRDGGLQWELNKGFWEQPTRPEWNPGAGGMCLHSIATWPGDPLASRPGDLGRRRVALRRRWPDLAPRQQGPRPPLHAGGGTRGHHQSLRPQHVPRPVAAGAAVHAVPRRRLPFRRRGRELGEHRGRPALRFRLPDGARPRRSGQRLRDPARRGRGPGDARWSGACLRDARRRRRAGRHAETASLRRTPTSRSSGRRSTGTDRAPTWASTSGPPRETCSAREMPVRRGSRRRRSSRRCIPFASRNTRGLAEARPLLRLNPGRGRRPSQPRCGR